MYTVYPVDGDTRQFDNITDARQYLSSLKGQGYIQYSPEAINKYCKERKFKTKTYWSVVLVRNEDNVNLGFLYSGNFNEPLDWKFTGCEFQAKRWINEITAQKWADKGNDSNKPCSRLTHFTIEQIEVLYDELYGPVN